MLFEANMMVSSISVEEMSDILWALTLSRIANEERQLKSAGEGDDKELDILLAEHEVFIGAERILRDVWARARMVAR